MPTHLTEQQLERLKNLRFDIRVVEIDPNKYDVIISGEPAVLDSFMSVYDNLFYIEKSKFGFPIVVAPDFPVKFHAQAWKEEWEKNLRNPAESCSSCPVVSKFFEVLIEKRGTEVPG